MGRAPAPVRGKRAPVAGGDRLGAVLVAGCRDAAAARQLGFVPTHGIGAALAMAHGRAGDLREDEQVRKAYLGEE